MNQLSDDVAFVLSALGIPRVHYIGLSIGGMIGQAFALEHPNRLISAMWATRCRQAHRERKPPGMNASRRCSGPGHLRPWPTPR